MKIMCSNVEVSEGHVQSIDLQFVPIPSIQFLREFSHITVLSIAYCGTPDIFLDLCQLTQLTSLEFRGNNLREVPPEIAALQNLETLDYLAHSRAKKLCGI